MVTKLTSIQEETLELIKANPGKTTRELAKISEATHNMVSGVTRRLIAKGYLRTEIIKAGDRKTRGPHSQVVFFPEEEVPSAGPNRIKPKPLTKAKPVKYKLDDKISVVLATEESLQELKELRFWKECAILRFPELRVGPAVLKAREALARHYEDKKQKEDILAGLCDKRPPMMAMIEVFS